MKRLSKPERKRRLARAQEIAAERATHWMVYRDGRTGWRLVKATSEQAAMKRVTRSTGARPTLPSREWRRIYEEVGLA